MLKKHLAVMLLFVVAAGVFSQSIPSGTGRYEALGSSPFILDAATDINNNPAWTTDYRDYSFGDIGRNVINDFELSDPYAGVSFGVTKTLALGLIINKRNDLWDVFGGNAVGVSSPIVPTTILVGYSANKNFSIGLAPYIAMWKHNYESSDTLSADTNRSSNSLGANLGVVYKMKGNKGWFEGVVHFRMNSYKNEIITTSSTTTYDHDGGMEIAVGLRGWFNMKSKRAIVPVLGFAMYSFTPKTTTGSTTVVGSEYTFMNINGGVGMNIPLTDDIQLAGGVVGEYNTFKASFSDTTGTYETKITDIVAPRFYMAGETRIADWLTGRFGFNRAIDMRSSETTQPNLTITDDQLLASNSVQTVSLGAGFHFGRFSIDGTVSERWLKQGINFVSGQSTDLFGVVSASYNFGK